jgi:hypothetical protein
VVLHVWLCDVLGQSLAPGGVYSLPLWYATTRLFQ